VTDRDDHDDDHHDPFHITATGSLADAQRLTVKHGETFAVLDKHGDMGWAGTTEHGLYRAGTRMLSRCGLTLDGRRPLLLSSSVADNGRQVTVDLTNPEIDQAAAGRVPQGTLHLRRSITVTDGTWTEQVTVHNYSSFPRTVVLRMDFAVDFADVFEVRGTTRRQRGQRLRPLEGEDQVTLAYRGLDSVIRQTQLRFQPPPEQLTGEHATYTMTLAPRVTTRVNLAIVCDPERPSSAPTDPVVTRHRRQTRSSLDAHGTKLRATDRQVQAWIDRAQADLGMLVTETEHGPYPYAGIPWFSTVFGRDGIITALQTLWQTPAIARGVLGYLAAHQATSVDPVRDAEPGKILHEVRQGEMADLGEIPFGRYYGTVDATPLFVLLAGAYYRRTGDHAFVTRLWPNILAALDWIEHFGDRDGDGFVEYARHNEQGLINQGWKDSHDAIFHADGSDAVGPIALCEVQAYVYAAYLAASDLASLVGEPGRRNLWLDRATALRHRFDKAFWLEELGTYALALDGQKRPCRVQTSNAGQCLYTGIAFDNRAAQVVATLLAPTMFSGWGIRTAATDAARYNPLSYHNGSVWPHDNALIAAGCARYGFTTEALQMTMALFDASQTMELQRLPELFCGFARDPHGAPTLYPVACAPQAWAAGAVPLLLASCLGLEIDAVDEMVHFHHPVLPDVMDEVRIEGLRVGSAELDLSVSQHPDGVRVDVVRCTGQVEVIVPSEAPR
jgi:glycogen debranching enzyme